jgi:hypothetical protein
LFLFEQPFTVVAVIVVNLDQRGSRSGGEDLVEAMTDHLEQILDDGDVVRPFARTAGDELQALLRPRALADIAVTAARDGRWWLGVGFGSVTELADTVNASRGPAFVHARAAVDRAKRTPWGAGADGEMDAAEAVDHALALFLTLLAQRSPEGWEAVDLATAGLATSDIAARLGISDQAVTKRLRAARWRQQGHGMELLHWLAEQADGDGG